MEYLPMRLPSAKQHNFSLQPQVHIQRSAFDRRHSNSFTFDSGFLVPFFHDADVLPGDTINLQASIFARLNTPYFPIMTNVYMMIHFWAVPHRILWDHWVNFMGERDDPDDTTVYMTPQSVIPEGGYATHSLQDYFGLPVPFLDEDNVLVTAAGLPHNVFLLRAYNMIYNRGYRDQNLQDPVKVDTGDGPDTPSDYVLLRRGKRHDYFTSALPWAQKGDPVGFNLSGQFGLKFPSPIDVVGIGVPDGTMSSTTGTNYRDSAGTLNVVSGILPVINSAPLTIRTTGIGAVSSSNIPRIRVSNVDLETGYVDMEDETAITINQFRQAFLAQEMLEVDARGGTRYPEMIFAHFGVSNPDARMQYPEYLGGDVTQLDITSVPQTSETGETPQGNLAAFGTFSVRKNGFVKSFTEHSVVIGLLCVYADLTYSQGLARHWSRRTRMDFYMPVLANLGEQTILNKEIYAQGTAGGADDNDVFGFQERWAEYRYMPNRLGGLFRPGVPNSMDAWNLSQLFGNLPQLNDEFIVEMPPFDRVVVVQDEPDFKADCYIHMTHVRPMPVQSIPVRLGGSGRRFF